VIAFVTGPSFFLISSAQQGIAGFAIGLAAMVCSYNVLTLLFNVNVRTVWETVFVNLDHNL